MIVEVLDGLAASNGDNLAIEQKVRKEVRELCDHFTIYTKL